MKICLLGDNEEQRAVWTLRLAQLGADVRFRVRGPLEEAVVLLEPAPEAAPGQVKAARAQCPMAALLVLLDAKPALRARLLEAGADDVLPPRTPPEEIVGRLSALAELAPENGPWSEVGELRLGPSRVAVYLAERPLDLGEHAYRILRGLVDAAPECASRETLMTSTWGTPVADNRLDAQIRRLRTSLSKATTPRIETVRGVGYRLGA